MHIIQLWLCHYHISDAIPCSLHIHDRMRVYINFAHSRFDCARVPKQSSRFLTSFPMLQLYVCMCTMVVPFGYHCAAVFSRSIDHLLFPL